MEAARADDEHDDDAEIAQEVTTNYGVMRPVLSKQELARCQQNTWYAIHLIFSIIRERLEWVTSGDPTTIEL
jgi:glutathione peroxidase-family protein